MRAARVHEWGFDKLRMEDLPEPRPGEGEVAVRMRAWSLNYRDLMVVRGEYNPKMPLPAIPLSDGAGEVAAVGSAVTRFREGDRVAGIFMQSWIGGEIDEAALRSALGGGAEGVAAETCVFHESGLVRVPDHLSWEEAATLPCAGVTAWHALVPAGQLRADEWVLVEGTGGVSMFALQFAKMRGARVIVTSSSGEKLERARALGADVLVNYRERPDWDKAAREATAGRGADHVIEVGGSGTMPLAMRAVRPGGTIHVIGVLSGRGDINFVPVFMRNLRLQGIFVGSRAMFEEMNAAIEQHTMHPVVDRTFPFAEFADALRYMEQGRHVGKICLTR